MNTRVRLRLNASLRSAKPLSLAKKSLPVLTNNGAFTMYFALDKTSRFLGTVCALRWVLGRVVVLVSLGFGYWP